MIINYVTDQGCTIVYLKQSHDTQLQKQHQRMPVQMLGGKAAFLVAIRLEMACK